ncbi:hypothetical protein T4B_7811 [Trichinella pseudospiralis]|uniref:Uncharacterized protein n=1 Tax=Trichinella pseudospiralis TaxID=6337 RepID=A0A0V1DZH1_TRIPS|nr:hypothetical protein T4A_13327 [Trichinella pseudospiralis]KRZ27882.1 hypothetical protein T4B_7811 [Trichinella pseudospiralis]
MTRQRLNCSHSFCMNNNHKRMATVCNKTVPSPVNATAVFTVQDTRKYNIFFLKGYILKFYDSKIISHYFASYFMTFLNLRSLSTCLALE